MDSVDQTLSYAAEMGHSVLVYGAEVTPESINAKVESLVGKGHVTHCDLRDGIRDAAAFERSLAEGLSSGRALHVSIDNVVEPTLLRAVASVLFERKLPAAGTPEGLFVISARVRWPSELTYDLREYFPLCVGVE